MLLELRWCILFNEFLLPIFRIVTLQSHFCWSYVDACSSIHFLLPIFRIATYAKSISVGAGLLYVVQWIFAAYIQNSNTCQIKCCWSCNDTFSSMNFFFACLQNSNICKVKCCWSCDHLKWINWRHYALYCIYCINFCINTIITISLYLATFNWKILNIWALKTP